MKIKENTKRLIIYLLLSFGLVWIPTITAGVCGLDYENPLMNLILTYSMLCPAISVILTRIITKEGLPLVGKDSLLLGIDLKNKKWIWYVISLILPIIYTELGALIFLAIFPDSFHPETFDTLGMPRQYTALLPLAGITNGIFISIGALGEELGWRTYMHPKLEQRFGPIAGILIGGIIWGIWHFPANTMGHNFGTDYWGEPWSGYIAFTLNTIAMGALLYLVTKKSGSVWPAAFLHAVNNSGGFPLYYSVDATKVSGIWAESPVFMIITSVPLYILGGIALLMIYRDAKQEADK